MNDGTELTHYGVKGMKWGKSKLGKPRGIFGKRLANKRGTDIPEGSGMRRNTNNGSGRTSLASSNRSNNIPEGSGMRGNTNNGSGRTSLASKGRGNDLPEGSGMRRNTNNGTGRSVAKRKRNNRR